MSSDRRHRNKHRRKHSADGKMSKKKIAAIVLGVIIFIFLIMCGVLAYILFGRNVGVVTPDKVDPTVPNVSIAQKDQKDDEVINVLLVGSDSRDPNADMGRSDSMMLVSYNKTQNKSTMISFLRDSLIEIPGHGQSRLGHSYAYGGVGLTINTLNEAYDLDIQNYIVINFDNLESIIDEIGGVHVYLTEEEAEYYRKCGMTGIQSGDVLLTGSQALAHARNRTLGFDYERTRRQRSVMFGIYRKIMEDKNPSNILPLINFCMGQVKTNMKVTDIYELAKTVLTSDDLQTQQAQVPMEGSFEDATYEGMMVLKIDFDKNKKFLEDLLY